MRVAKAMTMQNQCNKGIQRLFHEFKHHHDWILHSAHVKTELRDANPEEGKDVAVFYPMKSMDK